MTFQVAPGDRVGLVGRNGAGKTTLAKVLAGEAQAASGQVRCSAPVAYLPQDPRTGDLEVMALDRILGARGLDHVVRQLDVARKAMADEDPERQDDAMRKYSRLEERFHLLGGWTAESEAASIASSLGLPERVLAQSLGTLSGGQRRRVELSRVLFSEAPTLVLDEPTNHLDADSIVWLKGYLKAHDGGLIVISHDADLLEAVVNKVFHLDATRCELEVYRVGWKAYLQQRPPTSAGGATSARTPSARSWRCAPRPTECARRRPRPAWPTDLDRRAARLRVRHRAGPAVRQGRQAALPKAESCGHTPLTASDLTKSYGRSRCSRGVDLAVDRGSRVVVLGLNGAGKTTLLRFLAGIETPDSGEVHHGHGLKLGYYAQEHETLDLRASRLRNVGGTAPPR